MNNYLVILEGDESLNPNSQGLIASLANFKPGIFHALVLGSNAQKICESALTNSVFSSVFYNNDERLNFYPCKPVAEAVKKLDEKYDYQVIIAAGSSVGKEILPYIGGKLGVSVISDVVGINSDWVYTRPVFAGSMLAEVAPVTTKHCVGVRSSAFSEQTLPTFATNFEQIEFDVFLNVKFERVSLSPKGRPQLGDSQVVVSGGRAVGSKENFENLMFPLADKLAASVGATRAAVDAGYAPNDWQVGQTGKVVAPNLYIACGISGAIQHIAGMKDSKCIVAINKDKSAPIFEIADFGLVADIFEAVPELVEKLG